MMKWAIALTLAVTAGAADRLMELKPASRIAKDVAAFPRIAMPADQAEQRINDALSRADARVREMAKGCTGGGWSRSTSVAMRGPRYLALVAQDAWNCDNPHDDASRLVLVYDLSTGSPVNWSRLLPKSMVQTSTLDTAGDGTKIGVIGSRVLQQFYVKASKADPDCRQVIEDPELKFNLWPDAKADGIMIEPEGLPHAVAACGDSVLVPVAELRKMGVQAAMVDAIEAAHARGWYGIGR